MKKFNGVYENYLRWYDSETGNIIKTKYTGDYATELEFSRKRLKTRELSITPVIPEVVEDGAFYINGIPSAGGRIAIKTGGKPMLYISKRLIDFLYCSTNQPYRSCYSLSNGVDPKLEEMWKSPYIYIAYLSSEEMPNDHWAAQKYNLKEQTVPKMQGRAFVYTDGEHFLVGRPYGKYGFEIRDALARFFPNGLEEFRLAGFNENIIAFEQDNIMQCLDGSVLFCHDRLDKCFDKTALYQRKKIWINS